MEDLKKKFKDDWDTETEPQGNSSVFCDEDSTMKDDPKAKTIVVVDENLSLKAIPKYTVDVGHTVLPKKRKV
ncbi:hypothetical protein HanPI659440_Chr17g0687531 [Helianthus annuus]|nr:hypothetical protein HanOQP8_Chr17g0666851 [Helianthus annuus]KAJ0668295.1 hypothetical protein HanPI659440_Chr17g0687531 [Helianthus annuus]KAJ0813892.1 hypothetical protein HanPSC8_Chr17g0778941 [Helianthus annuus]